MRVIATIQSMIDAGYRLTAHHARLLPTSCTHDAELDLRALAERLGGDFVISQHHAEFLAMLRCTACTPRGTWRSS